MIAPTKILTEGDCHLRIRDAELALKVASDEEDIQMENAKILLWKRILFHVNNGKTVTLDADDYLQLWGI